MVLNALVTRVRTDRAVAQLYTIRVGTNRAVAQLSHNYSHSQMYEGLA